MMKKLQLKIMMTSQNLFLHYNSCKSNTMASSFGDKKRKLKCPCPVSLVETLGPTFTMIGEDGCSRQQLLVTPTQEPLRQVRFEPRPRLILVRGTIFPSAILEGRQGRWAGEGFCLLENSGALKGYASDSSADQGACICPVLVPVT